MHSALVASAGAGVSVVVGVGAAAVSGGKDVVMVKAPSLEEQIKGLRARLESDPALWPEFMSALSEIEGVVVLSALEVGAVVPSVADDLNIHPFDAATILARPLVRECIQRLAGLCGAAFDAHLDLLRPSFFDVLLSALNSPKDRTRIEGLRIAKDLLEKQESRRHKETMAVKGEGALVEARKRLSENKHLDQATDEQLATIIAKGVSTLQ